MDSKQYLLDWAQHYFKSRDAFEKKILSIEKEKDQVSIVYKAKTLYIVADPMLSNITNFSPTQNIIIVTINNIDNLEYFYEKWAEYTQNKTLKVYFINPFSTTEKKWVISPAVHALICDEQSLKQGLMSMFETVQPITQEGFEKSIES